MMKRNLFSRKKRQFGALSKRIRHMTDSGSWLHLPETERKILLRKVNRLYTQVKGFLCYFEHRKMVLPLAAGLGLLAATANAQIAFAEPRTNPFGLNDVPRIYGMSRIAKPFFGDLDGDGDFDMLVGTAFSEPGVANFFYYQNTGDSENPVFAAPVTNPFGIIPPPGHEWYVYTNGQFVDMDNDGDLDLVVGSLRQVYYYENTGTASQPAFAPHITLLDHGLGTSASWFVPSLADLDGDGDYDIIIGTFGGTLYYYPNIGTPQYPLFSDSTMSIVASGQKATPEFIDLDMDGDFDLLVGNGSGNILYFENVGTPSSAVFVDADAQSNPFGLINVGSDASPAGVDLDGDGDIDLMVGNYNGTFTYFENISQLCVTPELTVETPSPEICEGEGTTLEVEEDENLIIYWYSSADATEHIATGPVFTTPILAGSTTYWVEAVKTSNCVSDRIAVPVTVNPLPELTIESYTSEVCEGTPVVLNAASEGNTIYWYSSADATEHIATGAQYTTPLLTASTSYWVEAVSESGCISQREEILVTVLPAPLLTLLTPDPAVCAGEEVELTAETTTGNIIYWYDAYDAVTELDSGTGYTTPALTAATSYWVEAYNLATGCRSERTEIPITVNPLPELTIVTPSAAICEGGDTVLTATTTPGNLVVWYDSPDATEGTEGNSYTPLNLTETTSYWVQAHNPETDCASERIEITVTVLPSPVLNVETTEYTICVGTAAELYAASEGNVIFWYANEEDVEYTFHGNIFVIEGLTESTTYWVEAYNIATGCASERIEVTVTVNPVPAAPIAVEVQYFEEGETLADLDVEATGTLTWYADEFLTVELPETTPLVAYRTYYVTQSIGGCESEAVGIFVEPELGITGVNGKALTVYPNPTDGIVKIQAETAVSNIEVFGVNGQLVTSVKAVNEVNLSGYPSGTYVVRITLENGEIVTKKVIKK